MTRARVTLRSVVGVTAALAALLPGMSAAQAAPARHHAPGTTSLAQVLAKDKSGFDRNPYDFDILTAAVGAVLKAKPNSSVKVLADGRTALTAFLPNDGAFERLVADITKSKTRPGEKKAFTAVAGLGIDTVEAVLLYHVVPGATIDRKTALKSDGASLKTASGGTVKVDVTGCWWSKRVTLIDADRNDRNPRVVKFDINKGNKQIAHAINLVLRPSDLP
jgi:uncharacterized surface protein with fasciclin (FAS1) repeats